jgi:hypothetical protein
MWIRDDDKLINCAGVTEFRVADAAESRVVQWAGGYTEWHECPRSGWIVIGHTRKGRLWHSRAFEQRLCAQRLLDRIAVALRENMPMLDLALLDLGEAREQRKKAA